MEATATHRDGGSGASSSSSTPRWRTNKQMGSAATVSSRSGTIVSTYSRASGASRSSLSTSTDLELHGHGYDDDEHLSWGERAEEEKMMKRVMQLIKTHGGRHGYDDDDEHLSWGQRTKEEKMKRVMELVNGGATSAVNLKRWFTELRVAWVLDLPDAAASASALKLELTRHAWSCLVYAPRWIHALAEIVKTIRFTLTRLPRPDPCNDDDDDDPSQFFLLTRSRVTMSKILQSVKSKLFLITSNNPVAGHVQIIKFARFTQVAMLKMLAFVDVLVAVDHCQVYTLHGITETHKSLNLLLGVHGVLSKALHEIQVLFISSPPGEVQRILGEVFHLLSAMEEKAALDAIWLTLNHTTTSLLKWIDEHSSPTHQQEGSSDIHKVTLSAISHISFLMDNKSSLDPIISEADHRGKVHESRIGDLTHFDSTIIRMASRLQEKLAILSESFPDQGLRFLFLLNNSHRLHQCLWCSSLQLYVGSLSTKVDGYMQSYLQVSWAPVLLCLLNPTPCFLRKNYSPLTRFESKFHNTCTTQKLWMVPDPELRKTLRTAITQLIIPGYTKYIEENNITTPRLAPQELEEMLRDLFEG